MKLTTRDFEILEFLSSQGVATPAQISERFFSTKTSCHRRLHVLKSVELLESCSVMDLKTVSSRSIQSLPEVLGVGKTDLWKYRVYRIGPKFRNRRLGNEFLADSRMWKHQIQLNRMRSHCEQLFPKSTVLTDSDIRQEWARLGGADDVVIPDLVIRKGSLQLAIELERTLKSSRLYFERFQAYRRSSYSHVIYFCETETIYKKVAELSANFKKIAVANLWMKDFIFQERGGFKLISEFITLPA